MRCDLMTLVEHALDNGWPSCAVIINHASSLIVAIDKERGLPIVLVEDVEELV
jgi:hypothetical protein